MSKWKWSAGLAALVITVLAVALLAASVMTGCSRAAPTPTPTKTPKSMASPTPTPTRVVPPTAIPTASPTSAVTPTEEGGDPGPKAGVIDPAEDEGICPLTGLEAEEPAALERRPLGIKISNEDANVLPHTGLQFADIVFEHYAEGRATRFTAVYHSQAPEKVGSVRSVRLLDVELMSILKSVHVFSGGCGGVKLKITDNFPTDRCISYDTPFIDKSLIYLDAGCAAEKPQVHCRFVDTNALWDLVEDRGLDEAQDLNMWVFAEEPPEGGAPATHLRLAYNTVLHDIEWFYNADTGRYERQMMGEPHEDTATGEVLQFDNVVVVYANHVETQYSEGYWAGRDHWSIEIQLWGEGTAKVCRDGKVYEVRWVRENAQTPEDKLRFFDAEGNPFPLKPGQTWFQMVSLSFDDRLTIE